MFLLNLSFLNDEVIMLHICRNVLLFIGGYNLFDHPYMMMPIIIVGFILCFIEEK